jgi:hypothetical protein
MTVDERVEVGADPVRDAAVARLGELIEVARSLREDLVVQETICRRILDDVGNGLPVTDSLPAAGVGEWRPVMTESVKAFEIVRHRARLELVAMAIGEGMTITDVARMWNVSRQLASRWVQECAVRGV